MTVLKNVNVKPNGQNKNVVVVKTNDAGVISGAANISLVNVPTIAANTTTIDRLDRLKDVVAIEETENATLVYRAADDKYIVKQLDLDGGIF